MKNTTKRTTTDTDTSTGTGEWPERASDGKFAATLKTNAAWQRAVRRQAQEAARRAELDALYGDDACMYA